MITAAVIAGSVCCLVWLGALVEFARTMSLLAGFRAKYAQRLLAK